MEFDRYNSDNCKPKYGSKTPAPARVSIGKTGIFMIGKKANEKFGLVAGDNVEIVKDKADDKNWFLVPTGKKGSGFEIKSVKSKSALGMVYFSNSVLAETMRAALIDGKKESLIFLIGKPEKIKADTYWPLLLLPKA